MNEADAETFFSLARSQKQARSTGNMNEAFSLLEDMADLLNKYPPKEVAGQRTRYFYEYGMTLSVDGRPNTAALLFVASGETAELMGDKLRLHVGHFRHMLTLYLGMQKDADEAFRWFKDLKSNFPSLADVPSEDHGFRRGSEFNLNKRLMELAFESGATDFPKFLDAVLVQEEMVEGLAGKSAPHVHLHAYSQALEALYLGNFETAAAIYSVMLGIDLQGLPPAPDIKNLELVRKFANERGEELARDYLFLGRALMKCEIPEAKSQSVAVWRKGLELNPVRGNWRYLRDIREEIERL